MPLKPLFAIVRVEEDDDTNALLSIDDRISVTGVVEDIEFGRQEVDRLNRLNKQKGYRYVLQATRLKKPGDQHE